MAEAALAWRSVIWLRIGPNSCRFWAQSKAYKFGGARTDWSRHPQILRAIGRSSGFQTSSKVFRRSRVVRSVSEVSLGQSPNCSRSRRIGRSSNHTNQIWPNLHPAAKCVLLRCSSIAEPCAPNSGQILGEQPSGLFVRLPSCVSPGELDREAFPTLLLELADASGRSWTHRKLARTVLELVGCARSSADIPMTPCQNSIKIDPHSPKLRPKMANPRQIGRQLLARVCRHWLNMGDIGSSIAALSRLQALAAERASQRCGSLASSNCIPNSTEVGPMVARFGHVGGTRARVPPALDDLGRNRAQSWQRPSSFARQLVLRVPLTPRAG